MLATMSRVPLRDGWRVLARAPESVLVEIAWRWAFGSAFWVLSVLSFRAYFSQIQVTGAEYAVLNLSEPYTWIAVTLRALGALIQGVRDMGPILLPALSVLWLALATIGRGTMVRALATQPARTNWIALLQTNILRLLMACATVAAFFGAGVLASAMFDPRRYYEMNVVLMIAVLLLLVVIWTAVNWFVSLAQIFVASASQSVFSCLASAAKLYNQQAGAFSGAASWFALARSILVIAAAMLSLLPLSYARITGWKPVLVFVGIVSLLYFAASDALCTWRLAVHISLMERPEPVSEPLPVIPPLPDAGFRPDTATSLGNPSLKADGC